MQKRSPPVAGRGRAKAGAVAGDGAGAAGGFDGEKSGATPKGSAIAWSSGQGDGGGGGGLGDCCCCEDITNRIKLGIGSSCAARSAKFCSR